MNVDEREKGFVIVRGKKREVFFSFFVNSDSSSWTNRSSAAQIYTERGKAERDLLELRRRAALRRKY